MLRIITPEETVDDSKRSPSEEVPLSGDVEYVVGRRQMASLSLMVLVLIAVSSGISYIAGRAAGANPPVPEPRSTHTAAAPMVVESAAQPIFKNTSPIPANPPRQTTPVPIAKPTAVPAEIDSALVGPIIAGQRYLQVGAVERPVAVLLTESLRNRGLKGFIASGPTNGIYRVLVGPLTADADYALAKSTVDGMGIPTFTRQ